MSTIIKKDKMDSVFVVVDGNSLLNRAFYALPLLTNESGIFTNAVYGFARMLVKAIIDYRPRYFAVAFDLPKPTFRHSLYQQYKATRKKMPQELAMQMPLVKEMLYSMGIAVLEEEGFEADDILGTLAKKGEKENLQTLILTGDKDAYQLISNNTAVVYTKKGISEVEEVDIKKLCELTSLLPSQITEYKALRGDTADNIPGVSGIGDKTALSLLHQFSALDDIYKNLDKIAPKIKEKLIKHKDDAYLSKRLATINTEVEIEFSKDLVSLSFPFSNAVRLFFSQNNFKTLLKKEELFETGLPLDNPNYMGVQKTIDLSTEKEVKEFVSNINEAEIAIDFSSDICLAYNTTKEIKIKICNSLIDEGLSFSSAVKLLLPILENKGIRKILFDAKKAKKILYEEKLEVNNFFDVKLAQYIVDSSVAQDTQGILQSAYSLDKFSFATGLFFLYKTLLEKIEKLDLSELYYSLELPLVNILFSMEEEGFKLCSEKLLSLKAEFSLRCSVLERDIYKIAKTEFNINSPKQLGHILFEILEIPYPNKRKDGKFSTGVEILEPLEEKFEIVKKVLEFRRLSKLNNTFVEGLLKRMKPDGVVNTEFKQSLTTTGRLSSVDPNLQNIPIRTEEGRMLREAFIPKSKDRVLICADYSQIELRILAHFSKDPIMLEAFTNNEDIHTQTASEVFSVPKEAVTSQQRRHAKAINFGIIYGMSDFGLSKSISVEKYKAADFIERYFNRFSSVKKYLDKSIKLAEETGVAKSLFGRIRPIPQIKSANQHLREFGKRAAMNMPLQGTAADIIKIAMIKVFNALKGTDAKLILQVHDELVIDCKKKEAKKVVQIVKEEMQGAAKLEVPLVVDIGVGENWLKIEKVK